MTQFLTTFATGILCACAGIALSGLPGHDREERAWRISLALFFIAWLAIVTAIKTKDLWS